MKCSPGPSLAHFPPAPELAVTNTRRTKRPRRGGNGGGRQKSLPRQRGARRRRGRPQLCSAPGQPWRVLVSGEDGVREGSVSSFFSPLLSSFSFPKASLKEKLPQAVSSPPSTIAAAAAAAPQAPDRWRNRSIAALALLLSSSRGWSLDSATLPRLASPRLLTPASVPKAGKAAQE